MKDQGKDGPTVEPSGVAGQRLEDKFDARDAGSPAFLSHAKAALEAENCELKRREEVLQQSYLRFLHRLSSSPAVIYTLQFHKGELRMDWISDNITSFCGYKAEEVLRSDWWMSRLHPDDRERVLAEMAAPFPSDRLLTEYRLQHRAGDFFWVHDEKTLLRDAKGEPIEVIGSWLDITERKRMEEGLRESHEKFNLLADNITDALWIRSANMRQVHYLSPAFSLIWGRSQNTLQSDPDRWSDFIVPEDRARVLAAFATLQAEAPRLDIEYRITRPTGEIRWVRVRGFQVRDAAGQLIRLTGIVTDITERLQLEARLFQAQKMDTVGKLAGGVAHEFNSILTAIIGQSKFLLDNLSAEAALRESASEILRASERAATLTRQLLAYGRKQILQPRILDLNAVLAGIDCALRNLVGPNVAVEIIPALGLKTVQADAGQIEQVIINIASNAAEAMPEGGKLTLTTANVWFDGRIGASIPDLEPGGFVLLAITDTGKGMSPEVKAQVFEPFFSTKRIGQGSGLGLSTCYGIVKQSGGNVTVESELNRGATFKIYLPQAEAPVEPAARVSNSARMPRGNETILLAEDDPALREMVTALLRRQGYKVGAVADGLEALSLLEQGDIGPPDLLFTDVLMPNMNGKELAERVRVMLPKLRVLFTSGYTESEIVEQGVLNIGVAFLQKPFTPSALAHKLREILD